MKEFFNKKHNKNFVKSKAVVPDGKAFSYQPHTCIDSS